MVKELVFNPVTHFGISFQDYTQMNISCPCGLEVWKEIQNLSPNKFLQNGTK